MKEILKSGLILALYACAACIALALVYMATESQIAAIAAGELNAALKEVYPEASEFEDISDSAPSSAGNIVFDSVFLAKKDGARQGVVVQATGPTFETTTVITAVARGGVIRNVRIQKTSDTPGFGQKSTLPDFYEQFSGKPANGVYKAGGDMQAISGATISSNGIGEIIMRSCELASDLFARYAEEGGL